jgi:hypothetical protein
MDILTTLSANKLFIGVSMLISNLGSKYVMNDLSKYHEKVLNHILVKRISIFCLFFVATRDIMTSIILTFGFVIIIDGLLNHNSPLNLLKKYNVYRGISLSLTKDIDIESNCIDDDSIEESLYFLFNIKGKND